MSTTAPILEFDGVTAGYGRTTVLRDVSFAVSPGTVTAMLGANGAGKTTVLRAAAGLVRPTSGTIRLAGEVVNRRAPHQRAKAGFCLIPEGRGIFRSLTVGENLRLQVPPWRRGAAVDEALEAFPVLRDRIDQVAGTMSGGQQQMLALARAYLAKPAIVSLDEVSMGLAPKVVDEIFASLRVLAEAGIALLIVEQYVHRALDLADQVVLMDHGSPSYVGSSTDLDERELVRTYLGVPAEAH
ncbi:MAG TPA: ABC transporter ATP-binding protein [Marmoricola sp.]